MQHLGENMIDEIFEEYKKQENANFELMIRQFGIEPKELLAPNVNHDVTEILKSVNLFDDDVDSLNYLNDFYEKVMKEGILLGIGFGKTHMIKKIIEFPVRKSEILEIDLTEYDDYYPKFDPAESEFKRVHENGMERLIVASNSRPTELEVEISAISHIARIIDKNHKEVKKVLFDQFLEDFGIDGVKARYAFNKKIRIDGESIRPMLRSRFFMDKKGKHKVKKLLEDYFGFLIDIGLDVGIRVGLKLVIEDIKNEVLPYELIGALSDTETMMYIQKEHSEYISKIEKN